MHVISNLWFALIAQDQVITLLGAAMALAGQEEAVRKHKASLMISRGEK